MQISQIRQNFLPVTIVKIWSPEIDLPAGLCWWPSNFELSSPTKISSLKYPAQNIQPKLSSLKNIQPKISSLQIIQPKISSSHLKYPACKLSSLKYPAYKISSLKYPACKISSLKYPAFKISRFQTKRLKSSIKCSSKNPVNECNASIIPFDVCGNVVVPLVYNLNFRAVAALVVMHECHRTLHTFINYLNNSLPWRHYRTANRFFNFPPVARERC